MIPWPAPDGLKAPDSAVSSRQQAEALAEEQARLIGGRLATKTDIDAFRLATKTDIEALSQATTTDIGMVNANIEALRVSAKADLAETKADILKWMVSSIGIQTIVIVGAVTALVRIFAQ